MSYLPNSSRTGNAEGMPPFTYPYQTIEACQHVRHWAQGIQKGSSCHHRSRPWHGMAMLIMLIGAADGTLNLLCLADLDSNDSATATADCLNKSDRQTYCCGRRRPGLSPQEEATPAHAGRRPCLVGFNYGCRVGLLVSSLGLGSVRFRDRS